MGPGRVELVCRTADSAVQMLILLILLLALAVAWLWRRVDQLERRVKELGAVPTVPEPIASTAAAAFAETDVAPASLAQVAPEREPAPEPRRLPSLDFEDLFGRLLPIWTGGIALAVAGFFLVRWSIDAGLLTPPVRVVLAGLFGLVLLGGAEVAYRWRERVADPRVAQALSGAGLATLYAAFYLAGAAYGLIGTTLAFLGLAGVTVAAIGLSGRFGLPSAVLGLVGGFAAPALVGASEPNLVLLTTYLALVTAGLALAGRRQDRAWIGVAALAAGLGWGAFLVVGNPRSPAQIAVLGVYLVLLGAAIPALFGSASHPVQRSLRIGAAAIAALEMGLLVQGGGFGGLEWGLYLLLGAALAVFAWREPPMRDGAALAGGVGVVLAILWPDPSGSGFAAVAIALAILFAGVPLLQLVHREPDALADLQVTAIALGLAGALLIQFGALLPDRPNGGIAVALAALSALPATAAWIGRQDRGWPVLVAQAAAAWLGYAAFAQILPHDALGWVAAVGALALAVTAPRARGAQAALIVPSLAWAAAPLGQWLSAGVLAAIGRPMAVADLPTAAETALFIAPLLATLAAWRFRSAPDERTAPATELALAAIGAVVAHSLFRHLFAAVAGAEFAATGVIQRAAWEAVLLGLAFAAGRFGWRKAAAAVALLAAAHFAWFALALHCPLWADQAVGPLPLANALVPMFAAGLASLVYLRSLAPKGWAVHALIDAALMATIAVFALAELRHAFAGSLLTSVPVGPTEDLLRSLLGILLAFAFLLHGSRTKARSWRVGSLVLMVIAVLKVFLIDAAGLAGLARIASFMALGFALIGIGWFYSRQLRSDPEPKQAREGANKDEASVA